MKFCACFATTKTILPLQNLLLGRNFPRKHSSLLKEPLKTSALRDGVKEVVKSIRRGQKGVCVIAGNISPIDVITHVPVLCEEADIPYVYVPSKEDLASAGATKRPTCCVLVMTKPSKGELAQEAQEKLKSEYDQVASEITELTTSLF
ncbi:hypothetical protein P8452_53225 [Trifolium repens]|nr:hypothetical protein P8452_53225 [Trifolium repens]